MKKILSMILVAVMLVTAMPMAFAESGTYKVGDIIQFGSYPQSKVTDETLIAELNTLAPEWDNWTSYGYYSGNDENGTMVPGDWMRYTDVTYNGNKYRGVKFTQYRRYYTYSSSANYTTYQKDNGYRTNTIYWFKFEPIDWRVLDTDTGLVMCETIIDSQPYSNTIYCNGSESSTYAYFNDSSYKNYASDYETSSIRKWLNNDFYNTAFTDSEKKEINTTTLNNDGFCTSVGITGYEKLDSNSTNDKIFLLSYDEVRNSKFGFNSDQYEYDSARQTQGSDYAQSQGLYVYRRSGSAYNNNSNWILRSAGDCTFYCCYVSSFGYSVDDLCCVSRNGNGIRPALMFNQDSETFNPEHTHSYSSVITKQPTHLDFGEITYTCTCGDTYTETIEATGHTFSGSVCTECGYDKADACNCRCHKTGFSALIWKIFNFFQKLFGQNKTCACGVAHY